MALNLKFIQKILFSLVCVFSSINSYAESIECEEIIAIPAVITTQGKYCFKGSLSTNITSGHAIEIQTNNVTIDFNDYKLGGLAGGTSSTANGVYAEDRKNILLRNGNIRGFRNGVYLEESSGGDSSGHIIENTRFDGNLQTAMWIEGTNSVIRNNIITNTGGGLVTNLTSTMAIRSHGAGLKIENNIFDNTFGDSKDSYAVWVQEGDGAIVKGNKISNMVATGVQHVAHGIRRFSGTGVLFEENQLTNPDTAPGFRALFGGSTPTTLCRNNTVTNYSTMFSTCTDGGGNVEL